MASPGFLAPCGYGVLSAAVSLKSIPLSQLRGPEAENLTSQKPHFRG